MKKKVFTVDKVVIHTILILFSLFCVLPFFVLVVTSFSSEAAINKYGYGLICRDFDLTSYKYIFSNPDSFLGAYAVTLSQAFLGTFLSVFIMSMAAYALSRRYFRLKNKFNLYLFFTMVFSGGLVPGYILITQYLKLGNTFWVYIIPGLVSPWYLFVIRTFFRDIPEALSESALLDGAGEFLIFFKIILPLSKPVLATVSLMIVLGKWNDWNTSLLYITNEKLFTIQYLLQKMLKDLDILKKQMLYMPSTVDVNTDIPSESLRLAMAVVAAGPMTLIFPFFQKYFVKGLTIGSVKG